MQVASQNCRSLLPLETVCLITSPLAWRLLPCVCSWRAASRSQATGHCKPREHLRVSSQSCSSARRCAWSPRATWKSLPGKPIRWSGVCGWCSAVNILEMAQQSCSVALVLSNNCDSHYVHNKSIGESDAAMTKRLTINSFCSHSLILMFLRYALKIMIRFDKKSK